MRRMRRNRWRWTSALAIAAATGLLLCSAGAATAATVGELAVQGVDTGLWPRTTVNVVLPAGMLSAGALRATDFSIQENGSTIAPSSVKSLAGTRKPLYVVLVLDVSGSVKGTALENTKKAASGFVSAMKADDRVSLVAFSDTARVLSSFTGSAGTLGSAAGRLTASGETALYDAIVLATGEFAAVKGADKAIVLLSDGGDTVSGATADAAANALADASVPLYAVALKTKDFNPTALQSLARASGGRLVSASDSASLASMFTGLANQLQSPYAVTFTSLRPPAKDLEISVVVSSRDQRAGVTAVVANPDFSRPVSAGSAEPAALPSAGWPVAISVIVFLAVASLAGGVILLTRPQPNSMEQLRFYEQLHERARTSEADEAVVDPDSARGHMLAMARTVASKSGFDRAIRAELERAGLPLRPVEYMTFHVMTVLGSGLLIDLLTGNLLLTGVALVVLGIGPILLLSYLARKRTAAFQEQLPDVLNLLAGSLRAGWGLLQAVGVVVSETPAPAGPEFGRVVTETRLGLPLEDALGKMAQRMGSEDFKWAVTAIAIQREVGGNLAEVLDLVAQTVRERAALRRQVSALTSEGRLSAVILVVLPFIEGAALWMLNPNYFKTLLANGLGVGLMAAAAVLTVVGGVWLRRIVRIEV
jgi:tight adherence protein B